MTQTFPDKIIDWALAMKEYEGWSNGSRSFRNNNPLNLRHTPYTVMLGADGSDPDNFCVFPDYDTGFNAGCQLLVDACSDKLKAYKSSMTLLQFFQVYAPSFDNNTPANYANFVANKLGSDISAEIKTFMV